MVPPVIVYYVSGHGYGHAIRAREVMGALWDLMPDCVIEVRTSAPDRLFPQDERLRLGRVEVDAGMSESADSLRIDAAGTVELIEALLRQRPALVEQEAAFLGRCRASLVVSDIPYLAGDIAAAAGLECVGISNFTWNWIVEPFLAGKPEVLRQIEQGYSRMGALLQLPFGHREGLGMFGHVEPMPLLSGKRTMSRDEVRRKLGAGDRPVVWVALRGAQSADMFATAAKGAPEYLFLTTDESLNGVASNVQTIHLGGELWVCDLVAGCDVVLGKLGYGLVSDCVSFKTPLLHVPRTGFREDAITAREAPRYTVVQELAADPFLNGNWRPGLDAILAKTTPVEVHPKGGAEACAEALINSLLHPPKASRVRQTL